MRNRKRTAVSNRDIVRELREGSRRGYQDLAEAYQSRLIHEATGVYRLGKPDAEEIVNDVLMTVADRVDRFSFRESDDDFRSWVLTIFRNRIRDYLRKRSISEHLRNPIGEANQPSDMTLLRELEKESVISHMRGGKETRKAPDPEESLAMQQFWEVFETLKPWEQTLLRCRAMEIPYEEIAQYTGKRSSLLKVYHARVRKKLKQRLEMRFPGSFTRES
ncbi:MAG: sigma-70 family RNA polymerase sigma factor [Ignavibacteria bacterium]|nr:sigma-70 family RNA polymerase sigma factor [Ignavibacteria bacterium]